MSEPDPFTGQPVGLPVDATPAQWPQPVTLTGRYGRLESLALHHGQSLWEAVKAHDALWTYMSMGPFAEFSGFSEWIALRANDKDTQAYAVLDVKGAALGIAVLMEVCPAMRVCEVGSILYASALQRTPLGTEAQYLLARYAFEALGYRRYEWKCNALNAPSRAAALRYGFTFEGILRAHMVAKGRNRDTAYFSMREDEWPASKAAFEKWLQPENFDPDIKQKKKLEELRI